MSYISNRGVLNTENSSTATLNNGATFTGTGVDVSSFASIVVSCKTDKSGILYVDFSPDNTNWDRTIQYTIVADTSEVHRLSCVSKYARVRVYNNSGSNQTYLRLQTLLGNQQTLTTKMSADISDDQDTIVTRSVLNGQSDSGDFISVPVTPEGHLEVAVHEPISVFGNMSVDEDTPIFQTDFVYGISSQQVLTVTSGSGGASGTNQLCSLSTGVTVNSFAVAESRKRLRYRPGQGVKCAFTAMFTSPVANSYQGAGCGTAENGLYFGYGDTNNLSDTSFGILYVYNGKREIKTLTVTTGATSAGNVTVTLNGTAFTVAVTNASNIQRTVYEIASYTGYTGWDAYPVGATVVFIKKSAGTTAGTQSFSAGTTGSAASIAQTRAGAASTDTFIKQSDWNVDKLDGTGLSGVTLNPQKINIYRIKIGYLGAHDLIFQVKVTLTSGNNSTWVNVHIIKYTNLNTSTSFTNASFPFNSFAYSAGSTTNLTVSIGSYAGFIEGKKILHGNRAAYFNTLTSVGASNYQALFSILNPRVYNSVANQTVINLKSFSGAIKHTSPCSYYIIKNGTLVGNPNFQSYSSSMCGLWDTAATTVTITDNIQIQYIFHLGDTGDVDHHFSNGEFNAEEYTIQPGEMITLAAKSTTGTPAYVLGSINTREDQ